MTLETTIALTLLELEDELLLALELLNDLSGDLGLGELVGVGDDLLTVVEGSWTLVPTSPSIFSTVITSSVATLYCLPPVLTIAYMFYLPFMHQLVQQPNRIPAGENIVNESRR